MDPMAIATPKKPTDDPRDNSPARDSDDSGISDVRRPAGVIRLERDELEFQSVDLISEIRTVTQLTEDFCKDVLKQQDDSTGNLDILRQCREQSGNLLNELEFKIRPYLIRLDEEIGQLEHVLRTNIDHCKITDERVSWLLHYHQFMLEFRQAIKTLTIEVYDEMESQLRLRIRGVLASTEATPKHQTIQKTLTRIIDTLETLQQTKQPF